VKNVRVILISGLSGSGKTTAIKALEDSGFYCVDNLPIPLLPKFIELSEQSGGRISKVAVVEDVRGDVSSPDSWETHGGDSGSDYFEDSRRILEGLKKEGYPVEILFLDCSDPILSRRYSETRRRHPLAGAGSIAEGIRLERRRLQVIREAADLVIDTSHLNVHELKERIQQFAQGGSGPSLLAVTLLSFGYSLGIPYEADLVMDVRFLPNPYFVEDLRRLGGNDSRVAEYVLHWEETRQFLTRMEEWIRFLLPLYEREGKSHLTIAIGCTGGRHRSMVVVNQLARRLEGELKSMSASLAVRHRDAEKG
jgi:RNase adapter protein RapZ